MSTSIFHHHFRVLTAMSPRQYQKWMRLNEARRLMLTEHLELRGAGTVLWGSQRALLQPSMAEEAWGDGTE